ncbi:MAG: ADP compounds hydrolase NudE [Pseudomonadales bacterium]|nr:ADP compounds hydrolase NudE [Pseudomonadales bacterium]MCP5184139.1 ADP compounds hydrolase NudE [Pseudomonadales bacterium]
MKEPPLPEITSRRMLASSRLFSIEELNLRFSNGVERVYERLPVRGHPGIIVVAVNDRREVMLIREYAAGFHERQLSLPKGGAQFGEPLELAADRELKEEIGFGAREVRFVKRLNLAPGHMGFTINVMFARDLYPMRLPGDEPEPIEVVPWPVDALDDLIHGGEFNEARAIAALTLTRKFLEQG